MKLAGIAALVAGGMLLAGCGRDEPPAPAASAPSSAPTASAPAASAPAPPVASGSGDAAKGKQIWLAQCVVCHNADPAKDGPIGPSVQGASKPLLEARVLDAAYPPGYKPKRETKVMPARPDLAGAIPDLVAYLH